MRTNSRREFLSQVGQGMMIATVGLGVAVDLGLAAPAETPAEGKNPERLNFGPREALVGVMQDTPIEQLLPTLAEKLRSGTALSELVAAAALANARTFGGEDYIGFHSFMALAPAATMARLLPAERAPLPVFKVLYRNTDRMQKQGGSRAEKLLAVESMPSDAVAADPALSEQIRRAITNHDLPAAERLLAAAAARSPDQAFNALLPTVADGVEVHRTVLAYRAWDLLELVGREHALTFLRQSLHYCNDNCKPQYSDRFAGVRAMLPKLLDQYRLAEKEPGSRQADDAWIESMSRTIFNSKPETAVDAVAAALAEGMSMDSVGEAISLAGNQLVLRDPGRNERNAQPNKPAGSVHGDSVGVHACDSINAWRNMARASERRNAMACLLLAAWQAANDRQYGNADLLTEAPRPAEASRKKIVDRDGAALLGALNEAIRGQDQERACALVAACGEQLVAPEPVIQMLLGFAVSEDGALHAEKYFRTTTEEFARTRAKFRWRQLVALARVTASEYGQPAPGMEQARQLLGV